MSGDLNIDVLDYEGNVKPSSVAKAEHEGAMYAKRTIKLPSNQYVKLEYDVNSDPIYVGTAPKGLADGSDGWVLQKITWVSRNPTDISIAYGNWTNRASESY